MFLLKEKQNLTFHLVCVIGWLSFVSCLCGTLSAQSIGENTAPVFISPLQVVSDSGHTRLQWSLEGDVHKQENINFELQRSGSPDFSPNEPTAIQQSPNFSKTTSIYRGPDTATFLSGLPNGTYYFRVRSIDANDQASEWSKSVTLTVQHHSLQLAYLLFVIGMVVFAATVFVVVYGTREVKSNNEV